MRKSFYLLLGTCFYLLNACTEDHFMFPEESYEFEVESVSCFNGGTNLWVNIPNPEQYEYQWEVNGQIESYTFQTQGCQCIMEANILVTRVSDGLSIYKEFQNIGDCPLTE